MYRNFFLLVVVCVTVDAAQMHLEGRYDAVSAKKNTISQGLGYGMEIAQDLPLKFEARLSENSFALDSFRYKGELSWRPFSFLEPAMRLTHAVHPADDFSNTQLFFRLRSELLISSFGLFATLGWYERFGIVDGGTVLPAFSGNQFRDHDFAAEVGFSLAVAETRKLILRLSTFEEIDIYNLNNPFAELRFVSDWGLRWYALARYRVHLGFGQRDTWTFGLGLAYGL